MIIMMMMTAPGEKEASEEAEEKSRDARDADRHGELLCAVPGDGGHRHRHPHDDHHHQHHDQHHPDENLPRGRCSTRIPGFKSGLAASLNNFGLDSTTWW